MEADFILNDYTETKDCFYKGERYSVRDNGAVLRHVREGMRIRKNDNVWTFGKPDLNNGYMKMGSEMVHRIVAFAFLGEPPTPQHVVDHIDTNRRNNRPNNLRWLTKLENVLNNPITRKKIEYLCGSMENFVNDTSIIQEFVNKNPSYKWMRTVTLEEAKNSYERLCLWSKLRSKEKSLSGSIGTWIYTPHGKEKEFHNAYKDNFHGDNLTKSLTTNAMQNRWRTPTEFPLCPLVFGDTPLIDYLNNLGKGVIVTQNQYTTQFIDDFALCENLLFIRTHANNGVKRFALIIIKFEDGKYVHEGKCYFREQGAEKAFILAQGLEWNGEDGIDDYC